LCLKSSINRFPVYGGTSVPQRIQYLHLGKDIQVRGNSKGCNYPFVDELVKEGGGGQCCVARGEKIKDEEVRNVPSTEKIKIWHRLQVQRI
jgi:hypothetical protein